MMQPVSFGRHRVWIDTQANRKNFTDIEDAKARLSRDVYQAALAFERAEGDGLIHGNGHHMAQELASIAVKMMEDQEIKK